MVGALAMRCSLFVSAGVVYTPPAARSSAVAEGNRKRTLAVLGSSTPTFHTVICSAGAPELAIVNKSMRSTLIVIDGVQRHTTLMQKLLSVAAVVGQCTGHVDSRLPTIRQN